MIKMMLKKWCLLFKYHKSKVKCFSSLVSLNTKIGEYSIVRQDTEIDSFCVIGKHVYLGKGCTVTKSIVGNYCSIANYVSIGPGDHDIHKISTNSIFYDDTYNELTKGECIIGNDVWVGVGATIKRGVVVGNGAVIGAHTLVTKDVPAFAVVVGVPGKILKYRFSASKIQKIEESEWWNLDTFEAKSLLAQIEAENH